MATFRQTQMESQVLDLTAKMSADAINEVVAAQKDISILDAESWWAETVLGRCFAW